MPSSNEQPESGDSSHSLLSGRLSDMGSHYVMESGIYMSSYAATIFVTALLTIGILLLALLIALTVMLESCQRSNTGAYKQSMTNDQYDYCRLIAFQAELNNSEEDETPTFCKEIALKYVSQGQFTRELNLTVHLAESYFSMLKPNEDGLDVILMDIDDLILGEVTTDNSSTLHWLKTWKHPAQLIVFRFLMKLQASGWSLHFFTRKPSWNSNAIIETLKSAGHEKWSSLIMRSDEELQLENWEYISGRRRQLREGGYRIAGVISSRMDALQGPCLGRRNFKLARPAFYKL